MPNRNLLSHWGEIYLLSILGLKEEAYGVANKKSVSQMTGRVISYGGRLQTVELYQDRRPRIQPA
jgi:hypothetical protein